MVIISVDMGLTRTGVAASDPFELLASPVETITETNEQLLAEKIRDIAGARGAKEIVVGHPKNMDGSCGESAKRTELFADTLKQLTGLPVILWDERLTTVSATNALNMTNVRGKKRKSVIDTVAATIMLQEYLDSRRSKLHQSDYNH